MINVDKCRKFREQLGMSVQDAADQIGIRDIMLEHYEKLNIMPDSILAKYIKVLKHYKNGRRFLRDQYVQPDKLIALRDYRRKLNISQAYIVKAMNLSKSRMTRIETGKVRITHKEYNEIMKFLKQIERSKNNTEAQDDSLK